MIICYKLTDQNWETRNDTKWGPNITHTVSKTINPSLCTGSVLHYYKSIEIALILNPQHADINNPVLWEAQADCEAALDYGKAGCFELTTVKIIKYNVTIDQLNRIRARFAVKCALKVLSKFESKYPHDKRPKKAIEAAQCLIKNLCSGNTADTAYAAARAADAAADAADAADTAYAAERAAYAAERAAYAAADAARAARAARAAYAAADAAYAAARAAYAAADAAYAAYAADTADAAAGAARAAYAADTADKIDFTQLAKIAWIEEFQKEK